jgi:hypothetical protein
MVTGPAFQSIGYHTYTVFACLNACIIPIVYLFFPETAGKSLEGEGFASFTMHTLDSIAPTCLDMDVVFAQAYNEGVSPVVVSFRKDLPQAGSPKADEILGFGPRQRRNSSNSSPSRAETGRQDAEKQ